MSGLTKRGGIWHIDKRLGGARISGAGDLQEAHEILEKRVTERRQARIYGVRADHTFRAAATKYLSENQHKKSIANDALQLKLLDPFIGSLELGNVHIGVLQGFINQRRKDRARPRP